ncbi:MAG: hypothetical protein JNJ83_06290 [Verrucomicrobiaceae bacterium]|nr:hypothetical protein [Verrucomicrobiaceae bacterium]
MTLTKDWLRTYSWEFITLQNAMLCQAKSALHKPTSDGHETTRQLWESRFETEMRLYEAIDLCRRCHRMAPFCFYNGNTFAAVARDVIQNLSLPPEQAYIIRSLAGHIVAGVATDEEVRAFREFCDEMEK